MTNPGDKVPRLIQGRAATSRNIEQKYRMREKDHYGDRCRMLLKLTSSKVSQHGLTPAVKEREGEAI